VVFALQPLLTNEGTIMYSTPTLAARFTRNTRVLRADVPLTEDQMRAAAPSVFAESKHESRSERYTYIPTIEVLACARKDSSPSWSHRVRAASKARPPTRST
jgi:hypothetical protein